MDTRPSGIRLADAIIGILDCNFIDVGIVPTPVIEFAVRHFEADGGIIITASHNEPYWNGFKFLRNCGSVLRPNEMQQVIDDFGRLKDFHKIRERKIAEKNKEAVSEYTKFIFGIIGKENLRRIKNSNQKIVLDPNGGAGIIAKKILEEAGVDVVGINMNIGEFNREVEPTEDALVYLKSHIDENNADFAAAFDCDADRVEIIMKNGMILSGNYILALVAQEILSNYKETKIQTVVVNDATSNVVKDVTNKFNAKTREVEVGETNVVETMEKFNSLVGGEGSSGGAIISPSKCRDGVLTLLAILSIAAKSSKKLHEIVEDMPKYYNLKKKVEYSPNKHDAIKRYLKNYYSKKHYKITENGGIKGSLKVIIDGNSFVWFRASKTESNIFRIISDSKDKETAEKLLDEAVLAFKKANASAKK